MFDLIIFVIVISVVIGAVLENIRLKNSNTELLFLLAQLNIDNAVIKNKLNSDQDIEKDHLIKFLSETRDSSYEYIESFQKELKNFKNDLSSDVAYFDSYGMLTESYDVYHDMSIKFVKYYKKLISFLPEKDEDGR
ncbi:hypothetical protein EBU71_04865 [bacterium]|nr:hypothetical protein [Candidatus Elulimicrobium humile]